MFSSTGSGEEDELEDTGIDSFVIIDSISGPPLPTSTEDTLGETSTTPTPTATPAHSNIAPSNELIEQREDRASPSPPQAAPVEEEEAQSSEQLQGQELVNELPQQQQQRKDGVLSPGTGRGEIPPTPRANEPSTAQNETAADSGSIQSGEEGGDKDKATGGDGSRQPEKSQEAKNDGEEEEKIGQASGIGVEEGEERQEAVSPPAGGSLGQQAGLTGINEVGTIIYIVTNTKIILLLILPWY